MNKKSSGRRSRRSHSPALKVKVALAALGEDKTMAELCKEFELHPTQINDWKRQLLDGAADVFETTKRSRFVDELPMAISALTLLLRTKRSMHILQILRYKKITIFMPIVLLLLTNLIGCAGLQVDSLSRPVTSKQNKISRAGYVSNKGVDLYIRPTNRAVEGTGVNYLVIFDEMGSYKKPIFDSAYYESHFSKSFITDTFYMEMLVKANRKIVIDVSQVSLVIDGSEVVPEFVVGPFEKRSTRNYALNLCKPIPEKKYSRKIFQIKIGEETCFALAFKVPLPDPHNSFQFNLQNLSIDGEVEIFSPVIFEYSQETRVTQ